MRVGIDAQPVAEVRESLTRHGDRYRRALFTAGEIADCGGWGADSRLSAQGLAARFAAKEATIKVLRVTDRVPRWTEIEVVREPGGWTRLALDGLAGALAREAGLDSLELSFSHTTDVAVAVVIAGDGVAPAAAADDDEHPGSGPGGR